MAHTIWKYPVPIEDRFTISMPTETEGLTVQAQHNKAVMWALVDPEAPLQERHFVLFGTGHPISDLVENLLYIGTFQLAHGELVFHLFEVYQP